MKLAIIGDPKRKSRDIPLVKEGGEHFETTYVPITDIRFDLEKEISIKYNHTGLSDFDCIIPIPTSTYRELFYTLLKMLSDRILPFNHDSYLLSCNEELLFNYLNKHNVETRKFLTVASNISLNQLLEKIKFPVIVRPPNKKVVVTNKHTLKDVISLSSIGVPVRIESIIKCKRVVGIFVVGDDTVASYEVVKQSLKLAAIEDELKDIAIKIRKLVGCDYCSLRFLDNGNWILDKFTFSPDFTNFQKIVGKNIARYVIASLVEKMKKKERSSLFKKIEELFTRGT